MTLHLICSTCAFLDVVLKENAKNWKCPSCEYHNNVSYLPYCKETHKRILGVHKDKNGNEYVYRPEIMKH